MPGRSGRKQAKRALKTQYSSFRFPGTIKNRRIRRSFEPSVALIHVNPIAGLARGGAWPSGLPC